MQKWLLCLGLMWTNMAFAQTQLESDMLYLQQQVAQLRQTVLEQDSQIAQQTLAIQQLRGEVEILEHQLKRLQAQPIKQAVLPTTPSITNTITNTIQTAKPVASEETARFQKIYLLLEAGQDEQAIQGFQEFLVLNPNNQYADDAQYWLAEAYYSKQDFISALVAYEQLIERYENSSRRSQAELKIAYCYYELQDFTQAKALLSKIKQNYPQTAVARLAAKKLSEIKQQ